MPEQGIDAYLAILIDTLKRKKHVLEQLTLFTRAQEKLLNSSDFTFEDFEDTLTQKECFIAQVSELDRGFDSIYDRISGTLKAEKKKYQGEIVQLQILITAVTEEGVALQALEERNRNKIVMYFAAKKQEIKNYKVSSQTAAAYYKNMANQHLDGQTYFIDKKK